MKIVICGGHYNSALVVAEELLKKGNEVVWFGNKYSMLGDKNPSAEYVEVTKGKIPFVQINAGKLQTKYRFLKNLVFVPVGFIKAFLSLCKEKPRLVLSFGGYIALPVSIDAFLLGIPVITMEQTTVVGRANKIVSFFSKKILITFESSAGYFPKDKVIVTGLPLRKDIFTKGTKLFSNNKKTIYITGGKQGAHFFNEAVFSVLENLLEKFNVIHQCGSTSLYNDFQKTVELKEKLGPKAKDYLTKEYFFKEEIGKVFHSADFLISRAGAHTVYELLALEKPAILIPIPWSNQNEQQKNAEYLVSSGLAKILSQEDLKKGLLLPTVLDFAKNLTHFRLAPDFPKPKLEATDLIVEEIEKTVSSK